MAKKKIIVITKNQVHYLWGTDKDYKRIKRLDEYQTELIVAVMIGAGSFMIDEFSINDLTMA